MMKGRLRLLTSCTCIGHWQDQGMMLRHLLTSCRTAIGRRGVLYPQTCLFYCLFKFFRARGKLRADDFQSAAGIFI
uniref:Uncharacterized protein n=1 Tax=Arundo donax TaxID=35708 RepID=A0A0A9GB82_ARUDO